MLCNVIRLSPLWPAVCLSGCSLRYWKRQVKISRRSSTWLTVPGDPSAMTRKRKGNENAATRRSIPSLIYVSRQFTFLPYMCPLLLFHTVLCCRCSSSRDQFWNELYLCRHSWSKRSLTGSQQHEPHRQIWKQQFCQRDGSHGWRRRSRRCGPSRRRRGRSDSWLLLRRGRGRGGRRQRGHRGQRGQSSPEERPIQLRQGPGHRLLTPRLCPLKDWHTHREAGGWRYEDRNTVNPLDATTLPGAQTSEPLSSSGCYPDKANTLSHALLPNLQSWLIRIPLCTVTPLEATLARFFFLASHHHVVNIFTIPSTTYSSPRLCHVYHPRLFVCDFSDTFTHKCSVIASLFFATTVMNRRGYMEDWGKKKGWRGA